MEMAQYEPETSGVPYGPTDLTKHPTVAAVACDVGCTPAQALLRWSMQGRSGVHHLRMVGTISDYSAPKARDGNEAKMARKETRV